MALERSEETLARVDRSPADSVSIDRTSQAAEKLQGRTRTKLHKPSLSSSVAHAATTPGMSYSIASRAGSHLCRRKVLVVTGPIETARRPEGLSIFAAARSAKKLLTVEELVKVTASGSGFPFANNSRSCSIESG